MRRTWAARWWIMLVVLTVLVGLLVDRFARGGPLRRAGAAVPAPDERAADSPAPPAAESPPAGPPSAGPARAESAPAGPTPSRPGPTPSRPGPTPSGPGPTPSAAIPEPAAQGVHPGPYRGSALPLADGSAPAAEYTIKANTATRRSHGPDSPYYARTRAQVWFRGVGDAESAGFRHWSRKK